MSGEKINAQMTEQGVDASFLNEAEVPLEHLPKVGEAYDFVSDEKDSQLEVLDNALELHEKSFKLKKQKDEHEWRAIYLGRSFYLVGFVIYNALLFLLFSAVGIFKVADSVMIALLTTAAANVIGILAVAFKWLYNNRI